jgi:PTH1 family peptidyl-tRNA hydrolase
MKIIVGLRNPGEKYRNTRHNLGEQVIEKLFAETDFRNWEKPSQWYTSANGKIGEQDVTLVLPLTYMNESGKAVKAALENYSLDHSHLWVVHDDLDLPLGEIRLSKSASSAGHNGVQSIIEEIGTKEFFRFRLGIKTDRYQEIKKHRLDYAESYVLENFSSIEKLLVEEMVSKASSEIIRALRPRSSFVNS